MSLTTRTKTPSLSSTRPADRTVADLLDRLGGISPERVWLQPAPGTATEQDVIDANVHHDRPREWIVGVLIVDRRCPDEEDHGRSGVAHRHRPGR